MPSSSSKQRKQDNTFKHILRLSIAFLIGALTLLLQLACIPTAPSPDTLFARGHFQRARIAYAEGVRRGPEELASHLGLVRTLLRLDRWPDALREAEAAAERFPDDADARGLLALALLRAGQPERAAAEAKRAAARDPDRYWTRVAAGRVAVWNQDAETARREFRRATQRRPEEPEAWLGLLLTHSQKLGEASAEAETAARRYRALAPRGSPHDWMVRNLDDLAGQGAFARHFEKDPPFSLENPGEAARTVTIPIERAGSVVVLPVVLDGQPLRLIFDTGGGDRITLQEPAAKRLNLPTLAKSTISGAQGSEPSLRLKARRMTLGGLTFRSIPIQTIGELGIEGDGIFGANLLRDYVVTLDTTSSTLTLTRERPAPPADSSLVLPFRHLHGYPLLPVRVAGRTTWAFLDTGADDHSLSLRLAREIAAQMTQEDVERGELEGRYGIGGDGKTQYLLFQTPLEVTLGAKEEKGKKEKEAGFSWAGAMGMPDLDRHLNPLIEFEIGLLLGAPLLGEYPRITMDYPRRRLILELPAGFPKKPRPSGRSAPDSAAP